MSGKLEGKVAIVTGAGSSGPGLGTGRAMAVLFAREGAKVVLVDKFEDRARDTLEMIEKEGGEATIVTADLSDLSEAQRIVDEAVARYQTVDILVNNAAISSSTSLLETSVELLQNVLTINLAAPFMLVKAVVPVMQKGGGGAIVNISSIAALRGQGGSGQTAYASAKAGLEGLMYDVADAYGKDGIRVNLCGSRNHRYADAQPGHGQSGTRPEPGRPDLQGLPARGGRRLGHRPYRLVPGQRRRALHHRGHDPGRRRNDRSFPLTRHD